MSPSPDPFELALQLLASGQQRQAEAMLQAALASRKAQMSANDWFLCGVFHHQLHQQQDAAAYYRAALALDPVHLQAGTNLATLYLALGELDQALALHQSLLAHHPAEPALWNGLGASHFHAGDLAAAGQAWQRASELAPDDPRLLHNLAKLAASRQQHQEALALLLRVVAAHPEFCAAQHSLAVTAMRLGDAALARRCFDTLLQAQPQHVQAIAGLNLLAIEWKKPLSSNRLRLRLMAPSDGPVVFSWLRRPDFGGMLSRVGVVPENVRQVIDSYKLEDDTSLYLPKAIQWMIEYVAKEGGARAIGMASLNQISMPHRTAELMLGIAEQPIRPGLAIEAALSILQFAFGRLRLEKLNAHVYADNTISRNTLLSLGFRQEGLLQRQLIDAFTGKPVDVCLFALFQSDYVLNARLEPIRQRLGVPDLVLSMP